MMHLTKNRRRFAATAAVLVAALLSGAALAAEPPAPLEGTTLVPVAAEQSGLTHTLDLHTKEKPTGIKWPWMSPPVDINGDGHPDVMYYGHHGGGAAVWLGKGDGTFTFEKAGYKDRWVFGARDPFWWDFNGDGFVDAIGTEGYHVGGYLYVNDGTGHWQKAKIRYLAQDREGKKLRSGPRLAGYLADLDGDGRLDGLWRGGAAWKMQPALSQWGAKPPETITWTVAWRAEDVVGWPKDAPREKTSYRFPGFRTVYSVDLDGDDRNELIVLFQGVGGFSSDRVFAWVLSRDAGTSGWKDTTADRGLPVGVGHWLYPEDWDVDGDLDLIDLQTGQWYANDGKGAFARSPHRIYTQTKPKRWDPDCEVNWIDLDNDGRRDLIMAADHTSTRGVFLNLGGGKTQEVKSLRRWNRRQRKFGDVDHDGDLDLVASAGRGRIALYRNETPNRGLHVRLVPKVAAEAHLGCKLWVYRAGKLGEANGLIHYRQGFHGQALTRSTLLLPILHVGVGDAETVDLRVRFPSGVVREVKSAKAGSQIIVKE